MSKVKGWASCVSAAEESFYLHGFIAHVGKEEGEGEESADKTELRSESELVKQNMKEVYLQFAAGWGGSSITCRNLEEREYLKDC